MHDIIIAACGSALGAVFVLIVLFYVKSPFKTRDLATDVVTLKRDLAAKVIAFEQDIQSVRSECERRCMDIEHNLNRQQLELTELNNKHHEVDKKVSTVSETVKQMSDSVSHIRTQVDKIMGFFMVGIPK